MVCRGTIKLVDAANDVLHEELYTDMEGRNKIEAGWWKIYGDDRMENYFIHYEPDVPEVVEKRIIDKDIKRKYVGKTYHVSKF